MIRLSIILPTIGRPSLRFAAEAASRQLEEGDELLVAGGGMFASGMAKDLGVRWLDLERGYNWGDTERNSAIPVAKGTHIMFIDDDDAMLPGGILAVRTGVAADPQRPHIFRMINIDGQILPRGSSISEGNIGSPNMVAPNVRTKLGTWGSRYAGDFDFIASTLKHYPDGPIWHDAIIYGCREFGRKAWQK